MIFEFSFIISRSMYWSITKTQTTLLWISSRKCDIWPFFIKVAPPLLGTEGCYLQNQSISLHTCTVFAVNSLVGTKKWLTTKAPLINSINVYRRIRCFIKNEVMIFSSAGFESSRWFDSSQDVRWMFTHCDKVIDNVRVQYFHLPALCNSPQLSCKLI